MATRALSIDTESAVRARYEAAAREKETALCCPVSYDPRYLEPGTKEKISGDKVKQPVRIKNGIEQEKAKGIVKLIKDSKLKVAGSIQGDTVRVSGSKKDDLQAAIQLVRAQVTDLPLQFINFRD